MNDLDLIKIASDSVERLDEAARDSTVLNVQIENYLHKGISLLQSLKKDSGLVISSAETEFELTIREYEEEKEAL